MQERKMAGPFLPIPGEVLELFRTLKRTTRCTCLDAYVYMLNDFFVQQDPDVEGEWVMGRIRASHREVAQAVGVDWAWFQRGIWPKLLELGVVRDAAGGVIELPKLYKKGQSYIIPLQVTKELNELKADVTAIKETLTSLLASGYGPKQGENGPKQGEKPPSRCLQTSKPVSTDLQSGGVQTPAGRPDILLKGLKREKEISLSDMRNIISGFYRGIGQQRISKEKRERANKIFKKLRKDGFSAEDIAFAVEWTLENAKEEPYDFAIIEHTIGQAIAAREKEEAESREIEERERKAQEEQEQKEREEKEGEEIEAHKEGLDPDQRAELREKAIAEISESGDYEKEFVNDFIIGLKENEILRRKFTEENGVENESEH